MSRQTKSGDSGKGVGNHNRSRINQLRVAQDQKQVNSHISYFPMVNPASKPHLTTNQLAYVCILVVHCKGLKALPPRAIAFFAIRHPNDLRNQAARAIFMVKIIKRS